MGTGWQCGLLQSSRFRLLFRPWLAKVGRTACKWLSPCTDTSRVAVRRIELHRARGRFPKRTLERALNRTKSRGCLALPEWGDGTWRSMVSNPYVGTARSFGLSRLGHWRNWCEVTRLDKVVTLEFMPLSSV